LDDDPLLQEESSEDCDDDEEWEEETFSFFLFFSFFFDLFWRSSRFSTSLITRSWEATVVDTPETMLMSLSIFEGS